MSEDQVQDLNVMVTVAIQTKCLIQAAKDTSRQ
jgi:hypothetical protein